MTDQDLRNLYQAVQKEAAEPIPAFRSVLNRPKARAMPFKWAFLVPAGTALAAISLVFLGNSTDPAQPHAGNIQIVSTDELLMAQAETDFQRTDLLLATDVTVTPQTLQTSDVFFTSTDLLLTP